MVILLLFYSKSMFFTKLNVLEYYVQILFKLIKSHLNYLILISQVTFIFMRYLLHFVISYMVFALSDFLLQTIVLKSHPKVGYWLISLQVVVNAQFCIKFSYEIVSFTMFVFFSQQNFCINSV